MTTKLPTLPDVLPVFPLRGVLLLPGGCLPLNIFEPRYLAMVEAALGTGRVIGMIQPLSEGSGELFQTGCAGRITEFSELPDGRYRIVLTGLCRFSAGDEIDSVNGYRRFRPDWSAYRSEDLERGECLKIDRVALKELLLGYFRNEDLSCDWDRLDRTPDEKLITALSMICPLGPREKQALLEAKDCQTRADLFVSLIRMSLREKMSGGEHCH